MKSKKPLLNSGISYSILRETQNWSTTEKTAEKLNTTKQRVNYWLGKFSKAKWITKPFYGHYEITYSGKTVLDTYEQQFDKNLVRLENMRYKVPIIDGLEGLIPVLKSRWKKNKKMKNVDVYYTKIEGYSVSVFIGNEPSMTINCIKRVGFDIYELMHEAREEVWALIGLIEKDYSIVLGRPESTMQPEWAIPSEFAKILLEKTNSSQISTLKGVMNKSKGRNYDIETRDIRHANMIYQMPYVIDEIARDVKTIKMGNVKMPFSF